MRISGGTFDLTGKRAALAAVEGEMADAGFWANQERARAVVQQVKGLKVWVDTFDRLWERVQGAIEMDLLLESDPDPDMTAEVKMRSGINSYRLIFYSYFSKGFEKSKVKM